MTENIKQKSEVVNGEREAISVTEATISTACHFMTSLILAMLKHLIR
jgi:hypothetical protein